MSVPILIPEEEKKKASTIRQSSSGAVAATQSPVASSRSKVPVLTRSSEKATAQKVRVSLPSYTYRPAQTIAQRRRTDFKERQLEEAGARNNPYYTTPRMMADNINSQLGRPTSTDRASEVVRQNRAQLQKNIAATKSIMQPMPVYNLRANTLNNTTMGAIDYAAQEAARRSAVRQQVDSQPTTTQKLQHYMSQGMDARSASARIANEAGGMQNLIAPPSKEQQYQQAYERQNPVIPTYKSTGRIMLGAAQAGFEQGMQGLQTTAQRFSYLGSGDTRNALAKQGIANINALDNMSQQEQTQRLEDTGMFSPFRVQAPEKTPAQLAYEKARPSLGTGTGILSDLIYSTSNMAPSIAANVVAPGTGLAVTFSSSFGNAYNQALADGKNDAEAFTYGALVGASETGLQKAIGGVKALSNSTVGKVIGPKIQPVLERVAKSKTAQLALVRISDALGEGAEEYIQEVLEPVFRNIAFGENNQVRPFSQEALYSGLLGALNAGVLNLGTDLTNKATNRGDASNSFLPMVDNNQDRIHQLYEDTIRLRAQRASALENDPIVQSARKVNTTQRASAVIPNIQAEQIADATPQGQAQTQMVEGPAESPRMRSYLDKAETKAARSITESLGIQNQEGRQAVRSEIKALRQKIEDGTVTREDVQSAFDRIRGRAVETDTSRYDEYREVVDYLRTTPIKINEDVRQITDLNDFRRRNQNRIRLSKDGDGVDVVYQELSESYPELFPPNVANPTEQLLKIEEVRNSLDRIKVNPFEEEAVAYEAQRAFDEAYSTFVQEVGIANSQFAGAKQTEQVRTVEDVMRAGDSLQNAQKALERAERHMLLTDAEKAVALDIARGHRTEAEIPPSMIHKKDILQYANLQREVLRYKTPVEAHQKKVKTQIRQEVQPLVDMTEGFKDKKMGFQYERETVERNLMDIAPDEKTAKFFIEKLSTPIHENEAKRTQFLNKYRGDIKSLNLSRAESEAVQKLGEGVITEVPAGMDASKIKHAVEEFRRIYTELFDLANQVLVDNGYLPVPKRENYFPHFQDPTDPLVVLFAKLGMKVQTDALPTDIAGLTHTFKPGKQFFRNFLERKGTKTEYDAVRGFDEYIEGISNVIHHTRDIQRLRAFENGMREKYSDAGMQQAIQEIRESDMSEEAKEAQLSVLLQDGQKDIGRFSNFVTWLRSYTDSLAGKKAIGDRVTEHKLGRLFYSLSKAMEGRVASNMVALNPGSWLTNFIPIVQGGAELRNTSILKAMSDTMHSYVSDDGFVNSSVFLTNRRGADVLVKTPLEKVSETLSKPMFYIDDFTSNVLTRARVIDNQINGMDRAAAIREADQWAASVMADRSKGSLPTFFEERGPIKKAFTMFQLEVNNQISHLFKDMPRDLAKRGSAAVVYAILKYAIGAYLFNDLFEKLTGRRPALDFLGMTNEAVGDATGYKIPNVIDAGSSLVRGEGVDFTTNKLTPTKAMTNLGENIAQEVPFIGGMLGGGRIPISSALPDIPNLSSAITQGLSGEIAPNAAWAKAGKELAKPAYYLLQPVGGGQIKKAVEGITTVAQGGAYSTTSKGGKKLLYTVDRTPANYARAAIFGKSSLPGANEYYKTGKAILPESPQALVEVEANSLPRMIEFKYGEEGDRQTYKTTLSAAEQREYRRLFKGNLPSELNARNEKEFEQMMDYAKQTALQEVLQKRGVTTYEMDTWVSKALSAKGKGVPVEKFVQLRNDLNQIEPTRDKDGEVSETAARKKREALLADPNLTPEQKTMLDSLLIGNSEKTVDYTSKAKMEISLLQQTTRDKAKKAQAQGVTAEEFVSVYNELKKINAMDLSSKDKVNKQRAYLLSRSDLSAADKNALDDLLVNDVTIIVNDHDTDYSSSGNLALSLQSDSMQEKYKEINNAFGGAIPPEDFIAMKNAVYAIRADKDANGNAIRGTAKAKKIQTLIDMGMNRQGAELFYKLLNK